MTIRTQLLGVSFLVLSTTAASEPLFTSVDVFQAGTEGYHTFRIPAVASAPDGSLIAFAEGRKENRHDPGGGDINLVLKRSSDPGCVCPTPLPERALLETIGRHAFSQSDSVTRPC